jgi:hypothetical protein
MTHDRPQPGLRLRWLPALAALAAALLTAAVEPAAARQPSKDEVRRIVVEEARANPTVPVSLALAVARVESNFQADALSSAGARGVMQIMPATSRGVFGVAPDRLWDARTNVRLGVRYLEQLYDQYGQRWELALSHYNGGTLRGQGAYAVPHDYTRGYVRKVMAYNTQYARDLAGTQLAALETRRPAADGRRRALTEHPERYWVYSEPRVEKDWRSYLDAADYWLASPDEQARMRAAERSERDRTRRPSTRSRDSAYPPVHRSGRRGGDAGTGAYEPVDGGAVSRWERVSPRVQELRRRFFERLNSGQLG